jgi:hypothetical protein
MVYNTEASPVSGQPISRFPVPDLNTLPEDMRDRIVAVQEKSGFVPNVFLALAHLTNMRPNDEFYLLGRVTPPRQATKKRPKAKTAPSRTKSRR